MFYGLNTRLGRLFVAIQRRMGAWREAVGVGEKVVIYHIFRQYTFLCFSLLTLRSAMHQKGSIVMTAK